MKANPIRMAKFPRAKSSHTLSSSPSKTHYQLLADLLVEDNSLLLLVVCSYRNGGSADLSIANGILSLYQQNEAGLLLFLKQLIWRRADSFS